MSTVYPKSEYCPRCDRLFLAPTPKALDEKVKKHVAEAHPDYDPEWWDTYFNNEENSNTESEK